MTNKNSQLVSQNMNFLANLYIIIHIYVTYIFIYRLSFETHDEQKFETSFTKHEFSCKFIYYYTYLCNIPIYVTYIFIYRLSLETHDE